MVWFVCSCVVSSRRHTREVLKSQMSERDSAYRQFLADRIQESDRAIGFDKKCVEDDRAAFQKKSAFLRQFRDENKRVSVPGSFPPPGVAGTLGKGRKGFGL